MRTADRNPSGWSCCFVAAVLFFLLVCTGCGSSDDSNAQVPATTSVPPNPAGSLAETSSEMLDIIEQTVAIQSMTVEFSLGFSIDGDLSEQQVTGTIDFKNTTGTNTLSPPGQAPTVLRFGGDLTWLRVDSPQFDELLPDGARWIEAPTSTLVERGVISIDRDVNWAPLYFLAGARNVQVDPTGKTFDFEIDVAAIPGALTANQLRALTSTLQDFADPALVRSATGTTTINDAGQAVYFRLEFILAQPRISDEVVAVAEMTVSEIDQPVSSDWPPADEIASVEDYPELLDLLSGPGPGF